MKRTPTPLDAPAMKPSLNPEARENQMIALAIDLCEKRIREGTASSQEVVYWLKLGSTREKLEKEAIIEKNKLLQAKTELMQSTKRSEELLETALAAFRQYNGSSDDE